MLLLQVIGIAVSVIAILAVLRSERPEMATLLSLAAGLLLFFIILQPLGQVLDLIGELAAEARLSLPFLVILLRVIGVTYLVELAADVARDSGESAIASRIELAGRVVILVLAVPIVRQVADTIIALLGQP